MCHEPFFPGTFYLTHHQKRDGCEGPIRIIPVDSWGSGPIMGHSNNEASSIIEDINGFQQGYWNQVFLSMVKSQVFMGSWLPMIEWFSIHEFCCLTHTSSRHGFGYCKPVSIREKKTWFGMWTSHCSQHCKMHHIHNCCFSQFPCLNVIWNAQF